MYDISNRDYDEIIDFLSEFVDMTYLRRTGTSENLSLYNKGRRACMLVRKLKKKRKNG